MCSETEVDFTEKDTRKKRKHAGFKYNPLLERRKDHAHPQSRKLAF